MQFVWEVIMELEVILDQDLCQFRHLVMTVTAKSLKVSFRSRFRIRTMKNNRAGLLNVQHR